MARFITLLYFCLRLKVQGILNLSPSLEREIVVLKCHGEACTCIKQSTCFLLQKLAQTQKNNVTDVYVCVDAFTRSAAGPEVTEGNCSFALGGFGDG